jgi:hypothetical protein
LNRNNYINRILILSKSFFQISSNKPFSVKDKRGLEKDRRRLSSDKSYLKEDKRNLSSDKRYCPRQKAVFKEKNGEFCLRLIHFETKARS